MEILIPSLISNQERVENRTKLTMILPAGIVKFFSKRGFVIISTLDDGGRIHTSVKGVIAIETEGKIFVIDLYDKKTCRNLRANPQVTLTAINENLFVGFALQGRGKIIPYEAAAPHIHEAWEDTIIGRIAKRCINNIKSGIRKHKSHEAFLPDVPRHVIEVSVEHIIDLSPPSVDGT